MTIHKWTTAVFAITLAIPFSVFGQEQQAHGLARLPHYSVKDLGTLGGAYSYAYGLNNAGLVAGAAATMAQDGDPAQSMFQAPQTAFLWEHGRIRNLGTLGGPSSEAGRPNTFGEAAIISETATLDPHGADFCGFGTHLQCLGAIWKNGKLKALALLPGGNNSIALDVNDRSQVIGFADTDNYDPDCAATAGFQFQAVLWESNGAARLLSPLPGDTVAFGFGINNHGQAVGASGVCANATPPLSPNAPHAVLWERDGTPVNLGSLGGVRNIPSAISNRGDVSGTSMTTDGSLHAFLWTKESGQMRDLGTVPGFVTFINPCCNTINAQREIVGFMFDANFNSHAFYYSRSHMVDLNDLLSKDAQTEWLLQTAESINESGQIVGYGLHNGQTRAFLATPCHDHEFGNQSWEDNDR